ncbi:unnamed protein product [Clonostachys rosea f. rosea IK726]|uniref:Uncharacterized protein n=1 Tax=Clonostachys rosea f. rosea IK726 TaxID=1349383 RepID=A0ACA9TS65_BIOOC|nr:unnamed protein product [Clonostachys rosea f. rosea IK726]
MAVQLLPLAIRGFGEAIGTPVVSLGSSLPRCFCKVPPEVEGEDGAVVGLDGSRQQPALDKRQQVFRVLGRWNPRHVDLEMDKPESHRVPVASHHVAVMVARRPSCSPRNCPLSPTQLVHMRSCASRILNLETLEAVKPDSYCTHLGSQANSGPNYGLVASRWLLA